MLSKYVDGEAVIVNQASGTFITKVENVMHFWGHRQIYCGNRIAIIMCGMCVYV